MKKLSDEEIKKLTEEEKKYYQMIDDSAQMFVDRLISNSVIEHAVYLANTLFDFADDYIKIFSGKLSLTKKNTEGEEIDVYQNKQILTSLCDFLQKDNTKLEIVLEKNIDGGEKHPLIKAIKKLQKNNQLKGNFSIRQLKDASLDEGLSRHFIVVDDMAFRYETDPKMCTAFANFNDQKVSKRIVENFSLLSNESNSVQYNY